MKSNRAVMTEPVDVTATTMLLEELCPGVIFTWEKRRLPLQVGIRAELAAKVGDRIKPNELSVTLAAYVHSTGYLLNMAKPGAMRIGISGQPVEKVSPRDAASASKIVGDRLLRKKARQEAAVQQQREEAAAVVRPEPVVERGPKSLTLADLWQLALARKQAAQ